MPRYSSFPLCHCSPGPLLPWTSQSIQSCVPPFISLIHNFLIFIIVCSKPMLATWSHLCTHLHPWLGFAWRCLGQRVQMVTCFHIQSVSFSILQKNSATNLQIDQIAIAFSLLMFMSYAPWFTQAYHSLSMFAALACDISARRSLRSLSCRRPWTKPSNPAAKPSENLASQTKNVKRMWRMLG